MIKKTVIVILLTVLVVAVCIFFRDGNEKINYKVIDSGYISNFSNLIISNINDYNKFVSYFKGTKLDIDNSKYDKGYFKKKSLCVINISLGSSAYDITNVKTSISKDTLMVSFLINRPDGMVTTDMSSKLILVDVSKEITKIKVKEVNK